MKKAPVPVRKPAAATGTMGINKYSLLPKPQAPCVSSACSTMRAANEDDDDDDYDYMMTMPRRPGPNGWWLGNLFATNANYSN